MEEVTTAPIGDLLAPDEALVILGSLFWNTFSEEDNRYHDRSEIHPVQVVLGARLVRATGFDGWGALGVSSMAWRSDGAVWLTTGDDLVELQPAAGSVRRLDVSGLRDVHEITLLDDLLWLANTGNDEIVAFDIARRRVARRISLDPFRMTGLVASRRPGRDRFHCNQVFRGLDGRLYTLAHHVTGRIFGRRIARLFGGKGGDGGILDPETGERRRLWLAAPHTVTAVGDEYWVFDSGARRLNVYDAGWRRLGRIPLPGFGRGGAVSANGLFLAGISQWRRPRADREEARRRGEPDEASRVLAFHPGDRGRAGELVIDGGLEQINNVYVVPRRLGEDLVQFTGT